MTEMFGEAWPPMSVPDLAPDDDDWFKLQDTLFDWRIKLCNVRSAACPRLVKKSYPEIKHKNINGKENTRSQCKEKVKADWLRSNQLEDPGKG